MCGIVGIATSSVGEVDRDLVMKMNRMIARRGPDDEGYYWGDRVGLGMRRLAIIDVKAGRQPVHNEDKSVWVDTHSKRPLIRNALCICMKILATILSPNCAACLRSPYGMTSESDCC